MIAVNVKPLCTVASNLEYNAVHNEVNIKTYKNPFTIPTKQSNLYVTCFWKDIDTNLKKSFGFILFSKRFARRHRQSYTIVINVSDYAFHGRLFYGYIFYLILRGNGTYN